jgi:hypothetical protein
MKRRVNKPAAKSAKKSVIKPAKKPAKKSQWDAKVWAERCAWCAKVIPENQEVFGIPIRLRPEAFQEFDAGTIQPLLLVSAGKTVPMMVVTHDSLAKQEGKDAMFQACCQTCAKALQAALKAELGG